MSCGWFAVAKNAYLWDPRREQPPADARVTSRGRSGWFLGRVTAQPRALANFSPPAGGSPALPFMPPASAPVYRPAATAIPDTAGRLWHLPPRTRSLGVSGGTRRRPAPAVPGLFCLRPSRGILCAFLCRLSLFRGRTIIDTGLKKGGLRPGGIPGGIVVRCPFLPPPTRQHHDHRFSGMASVPCRSGRFHAQGPQSPPGQRPGTESAGPGDGRHHGGGGPPTPPGAGSPGPGAYTPHGGYVPRGRPFFHGGYIRTRVLRHLRAARPEPRSGEVGSAAGADGPAGGGRGGGGRVDVAGGIRRRRGRACRTHTGTCPDMGGGVSAAAPP